MPAYYGKETSMRNLTAEEIKIVSGAGDREGRHHHHDDNDDHQRRRDDDDGNHKVRDDREKERDD